MRVIRGTVRAWQNGLLSLAIGTCNDYFLPELLFLMCADPSIPPPLNRRTNHPSATDTRTPGGAALIYPGAGGNFMGCVFLNPLETWLARDIKGGMILGGNVRTWLGGKAATPCSAVPSRFVRT